MNAREAFAFGLVLAEINGTEPEPSAWDLLDEWLGTNPERYVRNMHRLNREYTVSLSGERVYTSYTQATLESAIRSALMVAYSNGER